MSNTSATTTGKNEFACWIQRSWQVPRKQSKHLFESVCGKRCYWAHNQERAARIDVPLVFLHTHRWTTKLKKIIYLLFLIPPYEVVVDRLKKNDYDIGHFVLIHDITAFLPGWRGSDNAEIVCDWCGSTFRTEQDRDEHIKKGCYTQNTHRFKLSKENEFFKSEACCPRNPIVIYADLKQKWNEKYKIWNLMMTGMRFTYHKQSNFT